MKSTPKLRQAFSIDKATLQDIFFIPILATSLAIVLGLLLLLLTGESYQTALKALIALFVGVYIRIQLVHILQSRLQFSMSLAQRIQQSITI